MYQKPPLPEGMLLPSIVCQGTSVGKAVCLHQGGEILPLALVPSRVSAPASLRNYRAALDRLAAYLNVETIRIERLRNLRQEEAACPLYL